MDGDLGKLFVGVFSLDTNEKRLKEYFGFGQHGEVVGGCDHEGSSHGSCLWFGFVVFSVPADAERVVLEKHMIDGRAFGKRFEKTSPCRLASLRKMMTS